MAPMIYSFFCYKIIIYMMKRSDWLQSACRRKIKLTAQIWNSSPEDSSVKNIASGAKTPKFGGESD